MKTFNIIVAVCQNAGIGFRGELPWKLQNELKYFAKMTKRGKTNAVIMGRKTWTSIPENRRPMSQRLNIVLTSSNASTFDGAVVCKNFGEALQAAAKCDNVWVIGGEAVYREALASQHCCKIYLTEIRQQFECDAFFPEIPKQFVQIENDEHVSKDVQHENGIEYKYKIFENKKFI